jgi:hypothetical protein
MASLPGANTRGVSDPDDRSSQAGGGSGGRAPEMVVPFVLYLIVIVGGLAAFIVVGLTHH